LRHADLCYANIMKRRGKFAVVMLLVLGASPAFVSAHDREPGPDPSAPDPADHVPQVSVEKSGAIATKPGLCLRLNANPGNVHIFTDESAQVSYRVEVHADSRDPGAEEALRQFTLAAWQIPEGVSLEAQLPWRKFPGRFDVRFEIHVPRQYSLRINTQGGNIEVQDIAGRVDLVTGGGNIKTGNVSPHGRALPNCTGTIAAQLETQGGHITVGDVAGTLRATTSGGHVTAGNISGESILRTGGGPIQTGRLTGVATLETGGGNIRVEKAGSSVMAHTAGGQIYIAEAAGTIHTQTGGGAVHIDHVTGPVVVETSGGGIFLGQVDAPLRAASGEGDMVVHLPRELAATIDAVVERNGGYGIVADPSLPLKISYQDPASGPRTVRAQGNLNGGGEILHLDATSGNIVLKLGESRAEWDNAFHAAWMPADTEPPAMQEWNPDEEAAGFFEEVRRRILESWWGGVPVDAAELQEHIEHSVAPVYPEVARKAGIEGDVALRVTVSTDGRVSGIRVLDGPPILARAAVQAVQQWQYQTLVINGEPTSVVTTLIVSFRLK
jgi:TonB family protein